jgi:PAS domain S-box-containing protein
MNKIIKILFVEDVLSDAELIWREIKKNKISFSKLLVDNKNDYMDGLNDFNPDIIISDFSLPQFDGMSALLLRNEITPLTPFILVTGSINEEVAVECMKAKADDYILKENLSRLGPAVINSINKIKLLKEKETAEEELQQSYMFNESLLRTIPFGMDIVDETGTILFQSEKFIRLFGVDGIGKKCWEVYNDNKSKCLYCPLDEGVIVGETETTESAGVLGGRVFEISHTGMMYQGKKAMLEIFQDITDRKQDEEELIKAKDKAEESDRLKTAFLHNISHEIRTPMNAIVGFSTLLAEPEIDAQSRQSYTDVIMQSSNHLLSIITDIVDISNIDANLVKVSKIDLNLNSVFRILYDQFYPKAQEKNLVLNCNAGLNDLDAFFRIDSTKLVQILTNLLSNAIKFTNEGAVSLSYKLKEDYLEFCVSDTGIGIAKDHHSKVFDRFYQVQNLISRIYEGTGLGLAISKAYVELLGGEIWISSEPGKGSSFYFTIPLEKQDMKIETTIQNEVKDSFAFAKKMTILVAEDIDSNFKLIKYFLSRANVNVLRASNGKEAVEKVFSEKIDLVLMDVKMPVMDGYTATKEIRLKNPDIPIIAQTAYADDKEVALECGCSGFISKPFDKNGLLKAIHEFI